MPRWRKNLYVLWVGSFVSAMCFTLMAPFLPLFLKELHVEEGLELWAGLCGSASFLMNAVMSPVWGALADRYGRKIMVVRSALAQAVVYSLQALVRTPLQFLGLRILNGTFSGTNPACAALAATNAPEEHVGYALGILQTSMAAGHIMGPLFGGLAAQYWGHRLTFLGSGVLMLLVTALIFLLVKEEAPKNAESQIHIILDLKEAFRHPLLRTVYITTITVQASLSVLQPVLSLQIARLGGAEKASLVSGIVYSLAGVATVIAAPYWAGFGQRRGYRVVLLLGLLGAGLLHLPMAWVTSIVVFGALRFATGLATAGTNLSVSALAARSVDHRFRGRAFGILASCTQFGQFLGPLAGGVSGAAIGLSATFSVAAVMLLTTAGLVFFLMPSEPDRVLPQPDS